MTANLQVHLQKTWPIESSPEAYDIEAFAEYASQFYSQDVRQLFAAANPPSVQELQTLSTEVHTDFADYLVLVSDEDLKWEHYNGSGTHSEYGFQRRALCCEL